MIQILSFGSNCGFHLSNNPSRNTNKKKKKLSSDQKCFCEYKKNKSLTGSYKRYTQPWIDVKLVHKV